MFRIIHPREYQEFALAFTLQSDLDKYSSILCHTSITTLESCLASFLFSLYTIKFLATVSCPSFINASSTASCICSISGISFHTLASTKAIAIFVTDLAASNSAPPEAFIDAIIASSIFILSKVTIAQFLFFTL